MCEKNFLSTNEQFCHRNLHNFVLFVNPGFIYSLIGLDTTNENVKTKTKLIQFVRKWQNKVWVEVNTPKRTVWFHTGGLQHNMDTIQEFESHSLKSDDNEQQLSNVRMCAVYAKCIS